MKKLNNKGLTIVELLASFIIISIIVIGMLEVVFTYRAKETRTAEETKLINYQNGFAKDIMTDILTLKVNNAELCGIKCVKITFMDGTVKNIEVPNINTYELYRAKYISYGGRHYEILENIPSGVTNPSDYQNIIFGSNIDLNIEEVGTDTIYTINFSMTHVDLDKDYGLHITFLRG